MMTEKYTKAGRCLLAAILTAIVLLSITGCKKTEQYVYTVTFVDFDGTQLKEESVNSGRPATPPSDPVREGYAFAGWNKEFSEIRRDTKVTAEYIRLTEMTFTVDTKTVTPGTETVEVTVCVANNPGILGMVLTVNYDDSVMALRQAENGQALSVLTFQKPSQYKNGCNFVWYGSETGEFLDGTILRMIFSVNPDAKPGQYPVTLSYGDRDIYDENCDLLSPVITDGGIDISQDN